MYPFWNPFYSSFMMPIPPLFSQIPSQMFTNSPSFLPLNPNNFVDNLNSVEISKNVEKNTQQPSIDIIEISSDSQQEIQQIIPPKVCEKKQPPIRKLKSDRFLGFKEGIFQKQNNSPTKSTMNLRKRAVLTRARLKKNKEKNINEKVKQKRKNFQGSPILKKVRLSQRLLRNEENLKNRITQKKPRNKQFGKLKKYLKCVDKTIDLPQMYSLDRDYRKQIQVKRENLMLRKVDQSWISQ